MLRLVETYHRRLKAEAASAGELRLPLMGIRMLLSLIFIAVAAIFSSVLGLDEPARTAVVLPIGGLTIMIILHLGYVFTEGFEESSEA